ncbi:MAG: hypothetical protein A2Y10_13320 [Planctomycetes bacterium GWF2_41_51]|nr:MAG: hypothetical protein A2Y10_13320 [Planctomycetes bacterium GWF2_41_51]
MQSTKNIKQMNKRDLFYSVMRFESPGRTLATLGGIWRSTFQRWASEGMPKEFIGNIPGLIDYLGLERHLWAIPDAKLFTYPEFERKVLKETDTSETYVNKYGIICTEFKKDAYLSMPHFEKFPVTSRSDWQEYKKLLKWDDNRIGQDWENQKKQWLDRDLPLVIFLGAAGSLYGSLRDMMGVEPLSYAFYDDPAMIEDMMDTVVELFCKSVEVLFANFVPDVICLWEDIGYKTSTLLGAPQMRQFMLPRYKIMVKKLREVGVPFIILDSDGYIDEVIPIWLEAGIDGVVPMEVQCGMDVAVYRDKYPRMLMFGGVDKKALAHGPDAIDREIEKLGKAIAKGGYVPWFDHGLPHDVSYKNFLYFVEKLKKVCGLE